MNFGEVYGAIDAAKGAEMVSDADALAQVLGSLLADPAGIRRMARAAGDAVEKLGGATNAVMLALEPFLIRMPLERG
jgi:3-deoxy-D-manno-octulosonic-acid transferase